MDSHLNQPGGSCIDVYVRLLIIAPLELIGSPDYYYYATAGGAKIWVRYLSLGCAIVGMLTMA